MGVKSDLAKLIDELPKLMQQYQLAIMQLEHQKQMKADEREYTAAVTMYRDSKAEAMTNEKQYEALKLKYLDTGLSLEGLTELFKTDSSMRILGDLTKIKADDYSSRADHYDDKAYNFARKADMMAGVITGDVRRSQNIMAGGAGPTGGVKPTEWDIQDVNIEAFKETYGEEAVTPQVLEYYRQNPGAIQKSLDALKLGDVKYNYYEGRSEAVGETSGETKQKTEHNKAIDFYNQRIVNAEVLSGKKEVDTNILLGSDESLEDIPDDQNKYKMAAITKTADIIEDLSTLYGVPMDPSLYKEYQVMFTLARGASMGGKYTKGDYGAYHEGVQRAYKHYLEADNKDQLQEIAQNIFGFRGLFSKFAKAENVLYTQVLLKDFRLEGQLDEGELIENLEDDEWDDLIDEIKD